MDIRRQLPHPSRTTSTWRLLSGVLCVLLGSAAAIAGIIVYTSATGWSGQRGVGATIAVAGAALLLVIAAKKVIRRGRRMLAGPPPNLSRSGRDAILFLRAFNDDGTIISGGGRWSLFTKSFEERMAEVLDPIGLLFALGRPDEQLPELGAVRSYVDDDAWQQRARAMIRRAHLVIAQVGESTNLHWELKECLAQLRPEQLILAAPFCDPRMTPGDRYFKFRALTIDVFPEYLPPALGLAQFISFGPGWVPQLLDRVPEVPPRADRTVKMQRAALKVLFESFSRERTDPTRRFLFESLTSLWLWVVSVAVLVGAKWALPTDHETGLLLRIAFFLIPTVAGVQLIRGKAWAKAVSVGTLSIHLLAVLFSPSTGLAPFALLDAAGAAYLCWRMVKERAQVDISGEIAAESAGVLYESSVMNLRLQPGAPSRGFSINAKVASGLFTVSLGLFLTFVVAEGHVIFYGLILCGLFLLIDGLLDGKGW